MRSTGIVVVLAGLVCAVAPALVLYGEQVFGRHTARAEGTVVGYVDGFDIDAPDAPEIAYADATGATYTLIAKSATRWRAYDIGEVVDVRYDPLRPRSASLASGRGWVVGLAGVSGAVFVVVGGRMILRPVLRRRTLARLRREGLAVRAAVTRIVEDPWQKTSGRHPLIVYARDVDPGGGQREFKSHALWSEPPPELRKGAEVDVYVDRRRPERYVMDVGE